MRISVVQPRATTARGAGDEVDRRAAARRLEISAERLRVLDTALTRALRAVDEGGPAARRSAVAVGRQLTLSAGTAAVPGTPAVPGTAARLRSSTQVNTATTSYTSAGPSWRGASTSLPEITGVYTGTTDDVWTFSVAGVPRNGNSPYRIDVRNQANTSLQTITMHATSGGAGTFTLPNGLGVTFAGGSMVLGDSFSVAVSARTPTTFDPTEPFDGTRADRPFFDSGVTVAAGSFRVNGHTIAVAASDTLNAVLARINSSSAGVTARFDAATDHVVFESTTVGEAQQITIDQDTSGLIAALKLSTAVLERGTDAIAGTPGTPAIPPDTERALRDVAAFAGVRSGTLTVNGVDVSIDVDVDTIDDVVDRISTQTSATAVFAGSTLQLSAGSSGSLELADTTGVLDAFGIATGAHHGRRGTSVYHAGALDSMAHAVDDLNRELRALLEESDGYRSTALAGLRRGVSALGADFTRTGYGALLEQLSLAGPGSMPSDRADFTTVRDRLTTTSAATVASFLAGKVDDAADGYLERLRTLLATTRSGIDAERHRLDVRM
jgi:hypothetical protein